MPVTIVIAVVTMIVRERGIEKKSDHGRSQHHSLFHEKPRFGL